MTSRKYTIISLLIALLSLCNAKAQDVAVVQQYATTSNDLPIYSGTATRDPKIRSVVWLSRSSWGENRHLVSDILWGDLALTQSHTGSMSSDFGDEYILTKITATAGNYILLLVEMNLNCFDAKQLLVSLNKDTYQYVDSVCVDAFQYYYQEVPYYPMSWRLTPSMNLTTSQLVPQSAEPIYVDEQHVQFPITAQRVDTHYTITPAGRFVRTGQTHYKPKSYTATEFMNENYNTLRDGTEEPLGPGEFEGPQPDVNPDLR